MTHFVCEIREEGRNGCLPMENSKPIFLKANRRFFLTHNTTPKWCHPEFILPEN
jgi:hypothetical protein